MFIKIAGFQVRIAASGIFVRIPGLVAAFVDRTGSGLTAVDWGAKARGDT